MNGPQDASADDLIVSDIISERAGLETVLNTENFESIFKRLVDKREYRQLRNVLAWAVQAPEAKVLTETMLRQDPDFVIDRIANIDYRRQPHIVDTVFTWVEENQPALITQLITHTIGPAMRDAIFFTQPNMYLFDRLCEYDLSDIRISQDMAPLHIWLESIPETPYDGMEARLAYTLKRLLEAGSDLNAPSDTVGEVPTVSIRSILEWACWRTQSKYQRHEPAINVLLSAGVGWQGISKSKYPTAYKIIEQHPAFKAHALEHIASQVRTQDHPHPVPTKPKPRAL